MAETEAELADATNTGPAKITPGDLIPALKGLTVGGAVRVNYLVGDYNQGVDTSATRGGSGNFALDTFRINLDYERGPWIGQGEYRFYPGYGTSNADSYHFVHTAWIGYNFESGDQVQAGLNRTPFGPGAWGVSQSFFFDQHYYVGLSDNMNIGLKYTTDRVEDWTFDFAYYAIPTPTGSGNNFGRDSARYSYDVVDETGDGYEESHQFNLRGIYSTRIGEVDADLGGSLQYGILNSNGPQSDGDMFAGSLHAILKWNNWTLAPQLTYYKYNVDTNDAQGGSLTSDKVVTMGAYDFPTEVAAEAWMPAVSLSYYYETPQVDWLDYIIPYIEYSSILKTESSFNNSDLFIIGSAFAKGGWYIYADLVFSNGNDFIGDRNVSPASSSNGGFTSQFGENSDDSWMTRFNINFGYYF
ncbi:MAG: hypothetical protein EA353_02665 [Puniceicoccaceae bacterium]|nr:MAG: hypothetical protein EA353_02665 [Puniceicoccaceae bacterium]